MTQRKIKFRVWNHKTKKWIHAPKYEVNLFGEVILLGGFMNGVSVEDLNDCQALQYTGLNDSKGTEIYEGDIMASRGNYITDALDKNGNYRDLYNVVVWNVKTSSFALKPIDEYLAQLKNPLPVDLDNPWTCYLTTFREVIGNVFDTPELLRAKGHVDK